MTVPPRRPVRWAWALLARLGFGSGKTAGSGPDHPDGESRPARPHPDREGRLARPYPDREDRLARPHTDRETPASPGRPAGETGRRGAMAASTAAESGPASRRQHRQHTGGRAGTVAAPRSLAWWKGRGEGRPVALGGQGGVEGVSSSGWKGQGGGSGVSPSGGEGAEGIGVPRAVLRQVRLIELRTRGWVNSLFGGEYHSVFKGQGMEFAEVREYEAGDDVRTIDWNVTARMGHPYVKKHVEERELTVLLAVDLSGSEQFGTRGRFKAEVVAEVAAVLALSAVRNNDRVGLLIFTDDVEHVVPPAKGRRHVLRLIRDVLAFRPRGRGTDIAGALDYAGRMLPHRSILFMLSDFQVSPQEPGLGGGGGTALTAPRTSLVRTLRLVSRRHDLVAIRVSDPADSVLPAAGLLVLRDPETGGEVVVDASRGELRNRYAQQVGVEERALQGVFRRLGIDEIDISTEGSYIGPLMAFFRARERKLRR
jgi:hypothetical protein